MRVNYGQTVHGQEEIDAVVEVLKTSTQMGPRVRDMQQKVAELFSKNFGIMVNSGSSANYLAVEILDLPKGSEVITPALTFATTVAPLVRQGLVPAFVDAAEGTYNIDETAIERMITPATSAVMIPSLIGNLPNWKRIREIADAHGLKVIEDSADTLGATISGESTGIYSDVSTTSFYGSHVINGAGNGGMLCVNTPSWRARLCCCVRGDAVHRSLLNRKQSRTGSMSVSMTSNMTRSSSSKRWGTIWSLRKSARRSGSCNSESCNTTLQCANGILKPTSGSSPTMKTGLSCRASWKVPGRDGWLSR